MLDTDLHKTKETEPRGSALDVDRFHHGFVGEPASPGRMEGALCPGKDGEIYCASYETERGGPEADYCYLIMKASKDAGRTWSTPWEMRDLTARRIKGFHQTVLRMKSGKLGLIYNDMDNFPGGNPGRDSGSGIMFRESNDEGRTWSDPVMVFPLHALCCAGHAIVLSTGRILVPAFRWISSITTAESESFKAPSLSYSFTVVSDDEGRTWKPGLSELFVSHYRATYDLEEPTAVELKDGLLLMDLRSQLGRRYRSYSKDGGISWTRPEPVQIASAYTPSIIRRMPGGQLLMIWSQASRAEILNGLHRHRLSCAISKDDGETWENFKNLESLDDETVIKPPPLDRIEVIEQWEDYGYYQPSNTKRYHRAPGVLRICYPDLIFVGQEAVVTYDYGAGTLGGHTHGTKVRTIPVQWFLS